MKVKIEFDPASDPRQSVVSVVDAAYDLQVSEIVTPSVGQITTLGPAAATVDAGADMFTPTELAAQPASAVTAEAPAPQLAAGIELDVDGVPWDARIHSDAAEPKTATGRWKRRRGIEQELYDSVTAELKLLASGKVGTAELPVPTAPIKTEDAELVEVAPDQFEVAAPAPAPAADPTNHVELMGWLSVQMGDGKLTPDDVRAVCQAGNLETLQSIEHMGTEWITWAYQSLKVRVK